MDWSEYLKEIDAVWSVLPHDEMEPRLLELAEQVKRDHGAESPVYGSMLNELAFEIQRNTVTHNGAISLKEAERAILRAYNQSK